MKSKLVHGIGVCDTSSKFNGVMRHVYTAWAAMLYRTTDAHIQRHPTYSGVTVCAAWRYLSAFEIFYDKYYIEGYALDKDILVVGNKVYSPTTCRYIPPAINKLLLDRVNARGSLPLGVTYHRQRAQYQAQVSMLGKRIHLGLYPTVDLAEVSYLRAKASIVKNVAHEFFKHGDIDKQIHRALNVQARHLIAKALDIQQGIAP